MSAIARVKAVLLDLDGTLYVEDHWIPGAADAVRALLAKGLSVRFLTNTTMRCRADLQARMAAGGIDAPLAWFFTPARAAAATLARDFPGAPVLALTHPRLAPDLADLPMTADPAQARLVLCGDMAETWNRDALDAGVRALTSGAHLAALQRNRLWRAADGLRADAGAYVAALEYASGVACTLDFGKPSAHFFDAPLKQLGIAAHEALMVGDDLEADVRGALACGLQAALVTTGKCSPADTASARKDGIAVHADLAMITG